VFIPLSINQKREGLKNIIIAGDTAGIFWVLSQLTMYPINLFLADTGIKRPLRDFPSTSGRGDHEKERMNVYYDYFDAKVGAGIYRRMDAAILTESAKGDYELLEVLKVPTVLVRMTEKGVEWVDLVGLTIIGDDGLRIIRPAVPGQYVKESQTSAWDRMNEEPDSPRFIEQGYGELDIIKDRNGDLVEFTGDLARVFDGLFEK